MPTKSKSQKRPLVLRLLIFAAFVAMSILLVLLNIQYINNMTDGTEKYSGDELVAAKQGLAKFDNFDDGIGTRPNFAKQRVKEVIYTPGEKCNGLVDENTYTYTLETISWFGIKVDEYVGTTCNSQSFFLN